MTQPYPTIEPTKIDENAIFEFEWIQAVVSGLRNIRGEMNIDPRQRIPALLQGGDKIDRSYAERFRELLIELARLDDLKEVNANDAIPESATAMIGRLKVLVPLGSIIDRKTELKRLEREIEKLRRDLDRSEKKLQNKSFLAKAPSQIVSKEQSRVKNARHSITELEDQYQRVENL